MVFCYKEMWLPPQAYTEQPRILLAASHGVHPGFGKNRWFWGLLFTFDFLVTNFEWSFYWTLCPAVCSSWHQGAVRCRSWHMPTWHPSTAICSEIGFPLPLALCWIEAVNVGILPSGVQLREVLKSQSSELCLGTQKMLELALRPWGTNMEVPVGMPDPFQNMWVPWFIDFQLWAGPWAHPFHWLRLILHSFLENLLCFEFLIQQILISTDCVVDTVFWSQECRSGKVAATKKNPYLNRTSIL